MVRWALKRWVLYRNASDMELLAAVSRSAEQSSYTLQNGSVTIPTSNSLADVIEGVHVVVDFTNAEGAMSAIRVATPNGVSVVIGSTGLTESNLEEADRLATENHIGIIVAPNFALGAVLMKNLAKAASRFFDYAELTEVHHEAKIDAPSGTALAIARAAVEGKGSSFIATKAEKETLAGTRGGVLRRREHS